MVKFWNFIVDNGLLAIIIAIIGWFAVSCLNNRNAKKEKRLLLRIQTYERTIDTVSDFIAQYRIIVSKAHHVIDFQPNYQPKFINPRERFFLQQGINENIEFIKILNDNLLKDAMKYVKVFDEIDIDISDFHKRSQLICSEMIKLFMNIRTAIEYEDIVDDLDSRLEKIRSKCETAFNIYGVFQEQLSDACYQELYREKKSKKKRSRKVKEQ